MKNKFLYLVLLLIPILFCSCASTQTKQNKLLQRGVYATNDAIQKQRFDLAKKYSNELTRIVPPPVAKERIKIQEIKTPRVVSKSGEITEEKIIAVLPQEVKKENIVIEATPEYQKLLEVFNKQLVEDNLQFEKFKKQTEQLIIEKDKKLQELLVKEANSGGFLGGIFSFFKSFFGMGIIGTIIILILVALFAPQFLPLLISLIGTAIKWCIDMAVSLIRSLVELIKKLFNKQE